MSSRPEAAARELGWVSLGDALALVILYAETEDRRFDRAAVRWLDRLLQERLVALSEARRACEWLEQLTGPDASLAAGSLDGLGVARGSVVRDRSVPTIVERPDVVADPCIGESVPAPNR